MKLYIGILMIMTAVVVHAEPTEVLFRQATVNGKLANEGFRRCELFVDGWLKHADPATGLIPKNLTGGNIWEPKDSAADNYPFMVLTSVICNRDRFNGRMLDILHTETKLTSRIGAMPDTYSFSKQGFADDRPDISRVIFGSAEYVKDGLLPLTEWLGPSPWSERMLAILDAIWANAPVETPYGRIVSDNVEVNGEMLQVLSRVHFMTGDEKYLDWAVRLGDYYLLGNHHPTRDFDNLRLRDHGCEIVSGLCELYAAVHFARPEKRDEYRQPIHDMLDRILEVGRNEDGLFYNGISPKTGEHGGGLADTWGYTYNGYYTVYLIDGTQAYREATRKTLRGVANYHNYAWEGPSSDGHADSIESALNLYNREPMPETAQWIDADIQVMWAIQKEDGVIEGWHGDGNFARTTIMYCLWKTQGITIQPWREDVVFGAVRSNDQVYISLYAEKEWTGKLLFDVSRSKKNMRMPIDWPRINQFPEWFTVEDQQKYTIQDSATGLKKDVSGQELIKGLGVRVEPGEKQNFQVIIIP